MKKETKITPIAYIRNDFKEKFGVPRQSGRVDTVSQIVFEPEFRDQNALLGIEQFSHLWLIFDFSLSHKEKWSPTIRPPRLGGNKRIGVFASRSPFRPNNLGLSVVKLLSIEKTADKEQSGKTSIRGKIREGQEKTATNAQHTPTDKAKVSPEH